MGLGGFIACQAPVGAQRRPGRAPAGRSTRTATASCSAKGPASSSSKSTSTPRPAARTIYAEVLGCGNTADAYHITAPHEDGIGAAEAMRAALRDAGWNPTDVQYVNAHGTSTDLGDVAETKAVKQVFGDHAKKLMISSTKSMIGHLLGASGGVEAIACALSLKHGVLHPTINLQTRPRPGCDLTTSRTRPARCASRKVLSNSFGFGGHNCSLAFGARS